MIVRHKLFAFKIVEVSLLLKYGHVSVNHALLLSHEVSMLRWLIEIAELSQVLNLVLRKQNICVEFVFNFVFKILLNLLAADNFSLTIVNYHAIELFEWF